MAREPSGADQRRAPRFPSLLRATVRVAAENATAVASGSAVVASVSRSGILVTTETRAALGQSIYFSFDVPGSPGGAGGTRCLAVGTVIDNREGVGFVVEFQGETAEMKQFFDRLEAMTSEQQWSLLQEIAAATIEIV